MTSPEIDESVLRNATPAESPRKRQPDQPHFRFTAQLAAAQNSERQAEIFYLQKQIQSQTPMVFVLEDGEEIEGRIEWHDLQCIKVRGRSKTLIYKSAIKYMYKLGEGGQ